MLDAVLSISEKNRFSKGIFDWVGFRTKWISFENVKRAAGPSKWSFFKLLKYSLEGILSFSTAILSLPLILGVTSLITALILGIVMLCTHNGGTVPSVWLAALVIGGINLVATGTLAAYLKKSYTEIKNRPIYLVRETDEDVRGK